MADVAYWPHVSPMARRTRGDLRTFAALAAGYAVGDLSSNQSSQLNTFINQEQEEWRREFGGLRGFAERQWTETWDTANTRHELPVDFAELGRGGRITLLDTSGDEDAQLEVIDKATYEQAWEGASNPYEDRQTPIAYLWGQSTNGRRFLEIRPTPTTAIQFRIYGRAYAENLDNDADELEAPVGMHGGIENGVAARLCAFLGNDKSFAYRAEAERVKKQFRDPVQEENPRPARVLSFDEAGGYEAFNHPES